MCLAEGVHGVQVLCVRVISVERERDIILSGAGVEKVSEVLIDSFRVSSIGILGPSHNRPERSQHHHSK